MTAAEVAKKLRIGRTTLWSITRRGDLRCALVAGKRLYRQQEVDDYINRAFEARYNRNPFAGMEMDDDA